MTSIDFDPTRVGVFDGYCFVFRAFPSLDLRDVAEREAALTKILGQVDFVAVTSVEDSDFWLKVVKKPDLSVPFDFESLLGVYAPNLMYPNGDIASTYQRFEVDYSWAFEGINYFVGCSNPSTGLPLYPSMA